MKYIITLLFSVSIFNIYSQKLIDKNIYLYGSVSGKINSKLLVRFSAANPKTDLETIKYFRNKGVDVVSWSNLFLPGVSYSQKEFNDVFSDNNINTFIIIKISDISTSNYYYSNTSAYASAYSNDKYAYASGSSYTSGGNISYTSAMSMIMEVYTIQNGFDKPAGVIIGDAINIWGAFGSASGLEKKIINRMVDGLEKEKAFSANATSNTFESKKEENNDNSIVNSNDASKYFQSGFAKSKLKDYSGAIADYTKAIQLIPNETTYFNRAINKYMLNDKAGAIEDYTKAIELNNNYSYAYSNRSNVKFEIRDYTGALYDCNKAIELDPSIYNNYRLRGYIYMIGFKNFGEANKDFTQAIQMNPNDTGLYFQRGMSYNYQGNKIEAIKDFSKSISLNPNNTDAYFMRALNKSYLNDRNGAISDYDEILKREKFTKPFVYNMATVYNNKAYCLVELGKINEALPLVTKALELDQSFSFIWDTRGEIYYKLGDFDKCISDMNRALDLDQSSNSYYYRGLSKIKLDKFKEGCLDLSKSGELGNEKAYEAISSFCK